jgi:hypothetical protein
MYDEHYRLLAQLIIAIKTAQAIEKEKKRLYRNDKRITAKSDEQISVISKLSKEEAYLFSLLYDIKALFKYCKIHDDYQLGCLMFFFSDQKQVTLRQLTQLTDHILTNTYREGLTLATLFSLDMYYLNDEKTYQILLDMIVDALKCRMIQGSATIQRFILHLEACGLPSLQSSKPSLLAKL